MKRPKCVAVYGLGYVGLTLCAAWLRAGFKVLGVDILEEKVKALNDSLIVHVEPKVKSEVLKAVSTGRFKAMLDGAYASEESDIKVICPRWVR